MKRPAHIIVLIAFAALITQGFQCASSDVAVAKRAIGQQDYTKAKAALERALTVNPADCEAMVLLGDVSQRLNDADGMISAYKRASTCENLKPELRTELSVKLYNAWVGQFNGAITKYNDYVTSKSSEDLAQAAGYAEKAIELKPMFSEPISLLGQIRENQKDTAAAISTYLSWWDVEKPGFDLMIQKGLAIASKRGDVIKTFGTPLQTKTDTLADGSGTIIKDLFDVGGRQMYTFSYDDGKGADSELDGWTYNPSPTLAESEKWRAKTASVVPLKGLAFSYYQKGMEGPSLEFATVVIKIKPSDSELIPLRTQLLQNMGKTSEAIKELKQLLVKTPTQITYRLQYATLLTTMNDNPKAIEQYNIVLKQDPTNETALYNLAAMYKNIAGEKQRVELEKMDRDKKYQPNQSYNEDLKMAAENFERLRKSVKYADDLVVIEQLANIYEVRKENSKVKGLIMELEALEIKFSKNKDYYRLMEGLYGRTRMYDKMKQAQEKGAKL
ncbi:MAG: tetratricopeptide repeat protein [Ignavibacteria bacterium]|nr:tetratricopeptide repeat protein [Ignavibacteria bacterium]